jgi:DNA-binding MarR family transcriptional regulator
MDPDAPMSSNPVPRALGRLRVALQDSYDAASRELGLSPQQAELLCAAMRPAAVGDLATVLRCDRSNISRLVDRAARRGLVERRVGDQDARVSMIQLTPEGRQVATRFLTLLETRLEPLLNTWTEERQALAVNVVTEVADALDRVSSNPKS